MDTEEARQIMRRRPSRSSGGRSSCVERRCVARRIVGKAPEDGLGIVTFQPVYERSSSFGIGSVLENRGIVNQRFGVVSFAANAQSHFWMVTTTILPAYIHFLRHSDI